ncbi:MAG: SLBB domain-containing protein [Bacteroidota bacterium]
MICARLLVPRLCLGLVVALGALALGAVPAAWAQSPALPDTLETDDLPDSLQDELDRRGLTLDQALRNAESLGIDLSDPEIAARQARALGLPEEDIEELLRLIALADARELQRTQVVGPDSEPIVLRPDTLLLPDTLAVAEDLAEDELAYFGYDTFRLTSDGAQPLVTIPVADDGYIVGPSDELRLTVSGDAEFQLDLTVDPEGRVFIPTVGQYTAAGQPLGDLRERLRRVLGRSYAGLLTNPPSSFMDLTLRRLQAVQVYVTGAVDRPGGYTVPSGTSVFNTLYLVGGPTLDGSLRRIRVVRNGQTVATVDAYDYLLEGREAQPVRLQNGDRVFVPPRGTTVAIEGAVRRPAFYEIRNGDESDGGESRSNEDLAALLGFAGGLEADAYAERFQIERIVPFVERRDPSIAREVRDLSLVEVLRGSLSVELADGDAVRIFSILDAAALASRAAVVAATIEGAVFQPGRYELGQTVRTVRDLVEAADGLRGDAYQARAELLRFEADLDRTLTRLDLGAALADDPQHNLVLRPGDVVRVYARDDLEVEREVRIVGRVRDPGTFPLFEGMTLFDLLFQGGGLADPEFLDTVLLERADLYRPTKDGLRERLVRFDLGATLQGGDLADFPLEPGDEVRVYERAVEEPVEDPFVLVSGAVASPGRYRLREGMDVEDAILQAGGFAEGALESRVEVTRMTERSTGQRAETREVQVQSARLFGESPTEGPGASLALQHRDRIYVRLSPDFQVQQSVVLSGEVLFPGQYTLQRENETLGEVIDRAGGLTAAAYAEGGRLIRNQRQVIVEIERALAGDRRADVVLQDNDRIVIPVRPNTVAVQGNVANEGLIKYAEGRRVSYYLERAGGTRDRTLDVFLTQASGATFKLRRGLFPEDPVVDDGAVIRVEREPEEEESADVGEIIRDTLTILSGTATVLVPLIIALQR